MNYQYPNYIANIKDIIIRQDLFELTEAKQYINFFLQQKINTENFKQTDSMEFKEIFLLFSSIDDINKTRFNLLELVIEQSPITPDGWSDILQGMLVYGHSNTFDFLIQNKKIQEILNNNLQYVKKIFEEVKNSPVTFMESFFKSGLMSTIDLEEKKMFFIKTIESRDLKKAEIFLKYDKNLDLNNLEAENENADSNIFTMLIKNYINNKVIAQMFKRKKKDLDEDIAFINKEVFPFLQKHNYNFNKEDRFGFTPLMIAVKYDYVEIIDGLLNAGANINYITSERASIRDIIEELKKKSKDNESIDVIEKILLENNISYLDKQKKDKKIL